MGSSPPTHIQAIAILSPRNAPIYVRQFHSSRNTASGTSKTASASADLRYHYFAHAGLDFIEERTQPGRNNEQYLGLLYTLEDLAVYGFQTSTRVKFMIMLSLSDFVVRDIDVLTIFRALHTAYLSYISNPFHSLAPNPSALLGDSVEEDDANSQRVRESLLQAQEFTLPLKARQIRSPAFDRTVDRIVGIELPPPPPAGQTTTQAAPPR